MSVSKILNFITEWSTELQSSINMPTYIIHYVVIKELLTSEDSAIIGDKHLCISELSFPSYPKLTYVIMHLIGHR